MLHCLDNFEQPNNTAMLDPALLTCLLTYFRRSARRSTTERAGAPVQPRGSGAGA